MTTADSRLIRGVGMTQHLGHALDGHIVKVVDGARQESIMDRH